MFIIIQKSRFLFTIAGQCWNMMKGNETWQKVEKEKRQCEEEGVKYSRKRRSGIKATVECTLTSLEQLDVITNAVAG